MCQMTDQIGHNRISEWKRGLRQLKSSTEIEDMRKETKKRSKKSNNMFNSKSQQTKI